MTLPSRGLGLLSLDVITNSKNVAFHFSGIKRKLLELYWSQTLCLLESLWGCGSTVEQVGIHGISISSGTSGCPCWFKPLGLDLFHFVLTCRWLPWCPGEVVLALQCPSPWDAVSRLFAHSLSSSFQKTGQLVGKLGRGRHSFSPQETRSK